MTSIIPKPPKGAAAKERRARRAAIDRAEAKAKRAAKERDDYRCRCCGWPWNWHGAFPSQLEAAHLVDKGMGGDHGRHSNHQRDFVTLCASCHRGPRSLHSGHLVAVYGPDMGDGPVTFKVKRC